MTGTRLRDERARERIRTETGTTLFVNAGAGSGKTTALVNRVMTLVLSDGVRLSNIAAVTFTEKAGSELRDRLRARFEERWRTRGSDAVAAQQALDDLDGAPIGTLHAFAQRLLTEHPIEAGLPPIIEVLDEVGSSVAFEERWSELQSALLDDDAIAHPLLVGMALGVTLKHVRSLALLLGKDWDLIGERVLATPPPALRIPDLSAFVTAARELAGETAHCSDGEDRLLPVLHALTELLDLLDEAPDTESRLDVLARIGGLRFSNGRAANWSVPVKEVRERGTEVATEGQRLIAAVQNQCLRQLTMWIARKVLDAADARRREGRLEFHDLLVLSRDLLRRDAGVRAALHEDYQRVLLDEFQDTDPIQVELATRICGGADAGAARWQDVVLPAGRLFVVGDSKQSIYRFRRASIATYLDAERHIGEPAGLTTNFRTIEPILGWVNSVFGSLIQYEDGAQPAYVALDSHRAEAGSGPAVTVLGAQAHADLPRAAAAVLREREAADVAAVVRQALDEAWQVYDEKAASWRAARPGDIAVLVPARTSLPYLEDAFDTAGVSYRAEASSLVYQSGEVRSLLVCARAIADTSDQLSLVTALRSPAFGCGDDDLWCWKHAGGTLRIYSELAPEDPLADGPVGAALRYLRTLSFRARWMTPSEVLGTIVADRRMLEVAATGPRARDEWRRLRFVVDQARAWSEVSHGGLRAYLAWAAHQGQETSRVAEAVLPETDSDSVRVMTVHSAKGLEFPIVVMSGMTAQPYSGNGVALIWTPTGYEIRFRKGVETGDFEAVIPVDEQMDEKERLRLLYVAATRARDHLVVSLHRGDSSGVRTAAKLIADAGGDTASDAVAFAGHRFTRVSEPVAGVSPPPPFDEWLAEVEASRAASRVSPALSASGLEGTEPEIVLAGAGQDVAAGLAKGARDLELPPWSKGRYGSAIGRAVHGVLQVIDLATGRGKDEAVAAQSLAEGVVGGETMIAALVDSALEADLVRRAAEREHWRETYVGTTREDGTILEGYIDLVFRDDDGTLVVVDYKTDAIPAGAVVSRVTYYRPQLDAYRQALAAATGLSVRTSLLFLHPSAGALEVGVP